MNVASLEVYIVFSFQNYNKIINKKKINKVKNYHFHFTYLNDQNKDSLIELLKVAITATRSKKDKRTTTDWNHDRWVYVTCLGSLQDVLPAASTSYLSVSSTGGPSRSYIILTCFLLVIFVLIYRVTNEKYDLASLSIKIWNFEDQ